MASNNRVTLDNNSFKLLFSKVYKQVLASGASETEDDFTILQLQQAYEAYQLSLQEPELLPDPEPEAEPALSVIELMNQWVEESKNQIVEATAGP